MASPPKVLIIGDDTRSFLACVRSLGRRGVEVHVAPYSLDAPALQSRYIRKVHVLPYYLDDGAKWLRAMRRLLVQEGFDMVLPCEERGLLPLFAHQSEFPGTTVLAIPDAVALEVFFDKVNTRQLAQRCHVVLPDGYIWQADSSITQLQAEIGFPMVAKHRHSYNLSQLYVRTQVRMLDNVAELVEWLDRNQPAPDTVYFEKVVDGIGIGVSVLCHKGQVLQAFEHHRANELAGSSYYRKSMPLHAERVAAVTRMVAAIEYTGLAMFEFKLNTHSGQWVLLEVNARPWGSLPLPLAWGVDFPYRLYQLLCAHQLTSPIPYPAGRYNRNLIGDIWQMRAWVSQLKHQPVTLAKVTLRWLAGFARLLTGREKHDMLVADDPRPAWAEAKQFVLQRFASGAEASAALNSKPRLKTLEAGQPRHLLFVCQGNICRSPYAERKARYIFDSVGLAVQVDSAGMLPRNQRASPAVALEAARLAGVDLSSHLSKCVDAELVAAADLIVIFDDINYAHFRQRHPEQMDKLIFLSSFTPQTGALQYLEDPDGKDLGAFQKVYARIDQCLVNLAQQLKSC
ncbi:MAG: hypothetical protein KAX57_05010 [Rhodoferax sp.]|nr:hypothetical protein [Rhodoferax sp.]